METKQKYQIITLTLSDRRTISVIVPEFCREGDRLFIRPQKAIVSNIDTEQRYQIITLTLSDGRTLSAIVPEFCREGDRLFIHPQFEVTEPRTMPDSYSWGLMPAEIEQQAKD